MGWTLFRVFQNFKKCTFINQRSTLDHHSDPWRSMMDTSSTKKTKETLLCICSASSNLFDPDSLWTAANSLRKVPHGTKHQLSKDGFPTQDSPPQWPKQAFQKYKIVLKMVRHVPILGRSTRYRTDPWPGRRAGRSGRLRQRPSAAHGDRGLGARSRPWRGGHTATRRSILEFRDMVNTRLINPHHPRHPSRSTRVDDLMVLETPPKDEVMTWWMVR